MKYKAIRDIEPQKSGSARMFKNPVIEKLTVSHISIPIIMLLLFGAGFIYWGTRQTLLVANQYIVVVFIGIFSWSLFEYIAHRFLYHLLPTNNIKGWIQYNLHGVHHEYPKDRFRLAMPPMGIVAISFSFFFIFRLFMRDFTYGFTAGFLFGYAMYLSIHYLVHAFQPPQNAFKVLWVNHAIHHYKDPDVAYGVSTPFWDFVFRTLPKKKTI
jgi:4-hydroxysphinganine ceramide fatty acyl 2-hydroxylase